MAITKLQPFNLDTTANYTFANITTNNANLGNTATANFFIGAGNNLSNIQGANVTGAVSSATTSGTVTTNAQPNITSVGTLTGLTSTGTVNLTGASNVALGPVANVKITSGSNGQYLQTDGTGNLSWSTVSTGAASNISNGNSNVNIPSANGNINLTAVGNTTMVITGTGANISGTANVTGNLTAGNIIAGNGSGGNITNANVISANTFIASGNITASNANLGNLATANYFAGSGNNLSNIQAANISGQVANALVSGTVYTNAQPNITSVGTLTDLSVSGNGVFGGNLTVNGTLTYINSTTLSISDPIINLQTGPNGAAPVANTGKDVGTALNYYDTSAKISWMGWDVSNAEIAFGSNVSISAEVVTFTSLANIRSGNADLGNNATANYFTGNGVYLTGITLAGLSNGNSNINIPTSNGNINFTAVGNANVVVITGTGANITGTANITGNLNAGNIIAGSGTGGNITNANVISANTFTASGNITAGNADLGNNATANYFIGSGNNLSNIQGANVSGQVANSAIAGTVYTNAQPNITSVGSLTGLVVSNATGIVDFTTTANVTLGAVANLHISGGTSAYVLSTDGAGNLSWVAQSGGASISNGTSNVNIPTANGNVNISAVGNANILVVTGTGANITGTANISGNLSAGNIIAGSGSGGNISNANVISANTFTASGNITAGNADLGNNATANYFIGSGNNLSNIQGANVSGAVAYATTANSVAGANVSGQVSNALISGTVYTNSQPNITSVGSLTGLVVSNATGIVDFTTTANVTLGAVGNLHISGGTGGYVLSTDGSGTLSWVAQSGGGGASISNGTSNVNIATSGGNVTTSVGGTANVLVVTSTGANIAGTLNVTGESNLGAVANVVITGGTSSYVLSTDGAGNLSWVAQSGGGGGASISNGNSNVNIPTANGNVNITAVGNATLVVTGTGANISGTANITGNVNGGNFIGSLASGNSNITITSNANITMFVAGNATARAVFTTTGANIAGTANITGLVTGGNFTTTGANGTVQSNNITITGAATGGVNVSATLGNMGIRTVAATYTDSGATGTIANAAIHYIATPTITGGTNAKTYTNLATFYIASNPTASTNATVTSSYAMFVASGDTYLGGNLNTGGGTGGNISGANVISATTITAAGNATVGNLIAGSGSGGNITGANVIFANSIVAGGGSGGNITGVNVMSANTFIGVFGNGNSNISIPAANGNITFTAGGATDELVVTNTGVNVSGTLNTTGNVTFTGTTISLGSNANVKITGGSSGNVLSTDGTGNLSWIASGGGGGSITITNDVTTNSNAYYPILATITSGSLSTANVSAADLYFNPLSGTLNAVVFNSISDRNKKSNIEIITNALDKVLTLNGVTFNLIDSNESSAGLIAQDVQKVLPSSVKYNNGVLSLNYSGVIGLLVEAIKEQQTQIDELKKLINKKV